MIYFCSGVPDAETYDFHVSSFPQTTATIVWAQEKIFSSLSAVSSGIDLKGHFAFRNFLIRSPVGEVK